jgi:hypothetical protein
MAKPSLRDRRRQEAREALYRAQLRRDQIIDQLVRNTDRIKKLRAQLARLDKPQLHTGPASVAEGKLLDELPPLSSFTSQLNDDIPDLSGGRR